MLTESPLGPLTAIAANARIWQTRTSGLGLTWAGLWPAEQRVALLELVSAHTTPVDAVQKRRWARQGALPGVRSYAALLAILPLQQASNDAGVGTDEPEPLAGIPIWDHGVFARASIAEGQHAVHMMRYLDDFHEPTLATLKRKQLRRMAEEADEDLDAEAHAEAGRRAAALFLETPMRWREVVEVAVWREGVRALEAVLQQRLPGRGRTLQQLQAKWEAGLAVAQEAGETVQVQQLAHWHAGCLRTLARSSVCLQYEERRYLQLTGVRQGRSVRLHLPRGLHLVFTDDSHRREDRFAHLWLDAAPATQRAGAFAWSPTIPPAYAARKRTAPLRLSSEDDVWRYAEGEAGAAEGS